MDLKECYNKKLVKKAKINEKLIISLLKSSQNKLKTNNLIPINKITISTKISTCYESLREILEAFAIKQGFKIYNHECFYSFLDEIVRDKKSAVKFDKLRKIRNQVNYYGEDFSIEETKGIKKKFWKNI